MIMGRTKEKDIGKIDLPFGTKLGEAHLAQIQEILEANYKCVECSEMNILYVENVL